MKLVGPVKAMFPYPLDDRLWVARKADLASKANDPTSYRYMKVVCLEDGWTYELQPDRSWKLFTAKGPKGDSIEFKWDGTRLGVRREGESSYTYQELKGKSIEFKWNGTKLGIKQEGDSSYLYQDLQGPKITNSEAKDILTTESINSLDTSSKNLVGAINELKGRLDLIVTNHANLLNDFNNLKTVVDGLNKS